MSRFTANQFEAGPGRIPFTCPFCGKSAVAHIKPETAATLEALEGGVQVRYERFVVAHETPTCSEFERHDPTDYLRAVRYRWVN